MGRGGMGGGGGHSSGGSHHSSGGRSFGSSSSMGRGGGSSRSSSSSSYSSRSRTSYSAPTRSYEMPKREAPRQKRVTPPPVVIHETNYNRTPRTVINNTYYDSESRTRSYSTPSSARTVVTESKRSSLYIAAWILTAIFIVTVFCIIIFADTSGVSKSTYDRQAIKPYAAFDEYCIVDDLGWLSGNTTVRGMEQFYKTTGVQPYLLISDNVDGEKWVDSKVAIDYLEGVYTAMAGSNEAAIILGFFEWRDNDVSVYYVCGSAAQTVMDTEACDILCDYTEALYTSDLNDNQYFATIWTDTADRIMSVTPTFVSRLPIIIGAVVVVAVLIFIYFMTKERNRRKKEESEETERILNTPLEKL